MYKVWKRECTTCGNTPENMSYTLSLLTRSIHSNLSLRAGAPDCSRRVTIWGTLYLSFILIIPSSYGASNEVEIYKLYTHNRLLNAKEFHCVDLLWTRESNWNHKANNKKSTAFGIPQLLKMKEKDPFIQIDRGLAYIAHRWITPCRAWANWKKVGSY